MTGPLTTFSAGDQFTTDERAPPSSHAERFASRIAWPSRLPSSSVAPDPRSSVDAIAMTRARPLPSSPATSVRRASNEEIAP